MFPALLRILLEQHNFAIAVCTYVETSSVTVGTIDMHFPTLLTLTGQRYHRPSKNFKNIFYLQAT